MSSNDGNDTAVEQESKSPLKLKLRFDPIPPEEAARLKRIVRDRLAHALVHLFDSYPLYYKMLQHLQRIECSDRFPEIDTIAVGFIPRTTQIALFYNYRYLARCSDLKLRALLVHEMQHLGLKHLIAMSAKVKRMVANLAADVVVNANIVEYKQLPKEEQDGITQDCRYPERLPDGTPHPQAGQLAFPSLEGLDLREESIDTIYNRLMQNPKETERFEKAMASGLFNEDDHGMWDDRQPTAEERAVLEDVMRRAVHGIGMRDPGNIPGSLRRYVEELRSVKTDWRGPLSMFAQSVAKDERESSWRRYNRRLGAATPGYTKNYRTNLLVAVDNSGSIGDDIYRAFMNHIFALSKLCESVTVVGCDTTINFESVVVDGRLPKDMDLHSGGGTDFQPVFDYAKQKGGFDGVIYLSDGYGAQPDSRGLKSLFAIIPGGAEVPGFKNIKIDI